MRTGVFHAPLPWRVHDRRGHLVGRTAHPGDAVALGRVCCHGGEVRRGEFRRLWVIGELPNHPVREAGCLVRARFSLLERDAAADLAQAVPLPYE